MKESFTITFDGQWRLARLANGQVQVRLVPADEGDDAAVVKAALNEMGYRTGGVCLALPSQMIVSARVNGHDIPRNRRRTGLLSLLEEQLPMDMESMTADFLPPVDDWSLGVAADTAEVKQLLDKLSVAGIVVNAICPTAVMALWDICRKGGTANYAFLHSGDKVDIFRLVDGKPLGWYTASSDPAEIRECVMADQLTYPIEGEQVTAWVVAEADWSVDAETALAVKVVRREHDSAFTAAARSAGDVLGGQGGWINLRRDGLAQPNPWSPFKGLLRVTAVMAILLPLVLAAAFYWIGTQYGNVADEAWQQEAAAFRKLNPKSPVPPGEGLNLRLRSDLTRLTGMSGSTGQVPPRVNSLETLRQIMAGLPPAIHLRVLDIQLSPTEVFLQGQARTHSDAEAVNRALAASGLTMESPATESLAGGGVSYTLVGKPAAPKKAGPAPAASQPTDPSVARAEPAETSAEAPADEATVQPATEPAQQDGAQ